jgi:type IV pilus assembly protein PilM
MLRLPDDPLDLVGTWHHEMASIKLTRSRNNSRGVVGLDIEPGYVAAAQARVNGSLVVERAAGAPLDLDIVREGEVLDPEALSEVLRDLFHESHLEKRVRVGVANQRTVLRMLELPPISDNKELAAAVRFQAQEQVPMPMSNAVLDFHSLGIVETPAGPRMRVMLVAAQRDMVDRLLAAVRGAGLRPEGVDLSAFAMIRALYSPQGDNTARTLYLNVGGLTNMAVAEGRVCLFTRLVGDGLEAMAVELAERRAITLAEARQLLGAVGLPERGSDDERAAHEQPAPAAPVARQAESGDELAAESGDDHAFESEPASEGRDEVADEPPTEPVVDEVEDVRLVLSNGVREIAAEVRHSLDFHVSQEGGGIVDQAVVSGQALEIEGFSEALAAELGIPVRVGVVTAASDGAFGGISGHHLAVAAGLAIEEAKA